MRETSSKDSSLEDPTVEEPLLKSPSLSSTGISSSRSSTSITSFTWQDLESPETKQSIRIKGQNLWKYVIHWTIHEYAGIKLMLLAQFFNAGMSATTRLLVTSTNPHFHPLQVLFIRMIITYVGAFIYMYYKKIPDFIIGPKGVRLWLVARGLTGFFGVFGLFYSLSYLELSDAVVIGFLTPTMAGFLAYLILGEQFLRVEIYGGLISMAGVILIARPEFLFGYDSNGTDEFGPIVDGVQAPTSEQRFRAIMASLLGVFSGGMTFVLIRKIGHRAHPLISVSYFSAWVTIVSAIGLTIIPGLTFVLPQTLTQWLLLFSLGIFGFVMQFCSTAAIQRIPASQAAALTYTQIIWALGWEKMLWNQLPDRWSFFGGGLILGSAIWVNIVKYRVAKQDQIEANDDTAEDSVSLIEYPPDHETDDEDLIIDDLHKVGGDSKTVEDLENSEDIAIERFIANERFTSNLV